MPKLYADDRDLEKLVRQGDSLSASTLKKRARKLGVEDIVADLYKWQHWSLSGRIYGLLNEHNDAYNDFELLRQTNACLFIFAP